MKFLRYLPLFLVLLFVSFRSQGATITSAQLPSGRSLIGITIEGKIENGDFEKFVSLVQKSESSPRSVWLASPGGNLIESILIGSLIRELKLTVWAPDSKNRTWMHLIRQENNLCASSCFFIYAAGVNRYGKILGVHRPYLSKEDYETLTLDNAANTHNKAQALSSVYLRKMGVPSVLFEELMAVGSDQLKWLTEEEVAQLQNMIPEYQEWFKARCTPKSLLAEPWKTDARLECESKLLKQEQDQAFDSFWTKYEIKKYSATVKEINELNQLIPEYMEWAKARCAPKAIIIDSRNTDNQFDCESTLLKLERNSPTESFWRNYMFKKYTE